jgi:endonuclease YncB( thermonuclease family)
LQSLSKLLQRFATFVLISAATQACFADALVGRVVGLSDGDTITVLDARLSQHKIRLAGIDAPEKGQPFGNRSKASLSSLVMGRSVEVEWHKRDRYGRVVGVVRVGTQDVGLAQVRAGMAGHYKAYEREQGLVERRAYVSAEEEARALSKGLWADRQPQAPWEYRASKRQRRRHSAGLP